MLFGLQTVIVVLPGPRTRTRNDVPRLRQRGTHPVPAVSGIRHAQPRACPRHANLCNVQTALRDLIGMGQFHVYRMTGGFGWPATPTQT